MSGVRGAFYRAKVLLVAGQLAAGAVLATGCARGAPGRTHSDAGGQDDGGPDPALCGNGVLDPGEGCDDGNTLDGDGCSSVCQLESCDGSNCPQGCCDRSGVCMPGTQDLVCGSGGGPCEDCTGSDHYCQDRQCVDLGQCTEGETTNCGNCGTRICGADGRWGSCENQGECAPGQQEATGACGNCGHLQRVCQTDCTWSSWGCAGEGICSPDDVETGGECGQCGHEERTCQTDCSWDSWICVEDGVLQTYYRDSDGDSYGDPNSSTQACSAPAGYVFNSADCDDTNPGIHPGVNDACANCIDEDCNGVDAPCDSSASIVFSPNSPPPNSTVQVVVQADPGYACVWLEVQGPGMNDQLGNPAVGGGPPYTWTWNVGLGSAGTYRFKFTVNNHAPCTITHDSIVCRVLEVN